MSNEDNKLELVSQLRDVKFYLENFTKIKGKRPGQLIPFILNEAQKDLFNTVNTHSRVIILKARQLGFCAQPSQKVLTADLRWKTIDELRIGEEIVAVDEFPPNGKGQSRKMRKAVVENKFDVSEPALRIVMDDGRELVITPEHRMMCRKWGMRTEWREAKNFEIGDEIRYITKTWSEPNYEDGWFSGMLDGEGCLAKPSRSGSLVTVSQVEGPVWDRVREYLDSNGYNYRIEVDKREPGGTSKFGSKEVNKAVVGTTDELIRLIGKTRPSRFSDKRFWESKSIPNNGWAKIVRIEKLQKQRMVDVQTSESTYILEGFVSHNSTAMVGYFYHKTITTPGTNTALIGYNSDMAAELLDKVKLFYKTTPPELSPTLHYNSKYEISFPNLDSKISVLPSTDDVGRGYTLHNCLCTELAFWEKADEKMQTLEASVPKDGKLVIESTPNGVGNLYHRTWVTKGNDYAKKEYGWWWGYCFDDRTEVLTEDGWKGPDEFEIGDRHYTVNMDTKDIELLPATDKYDSLYEGEMVRFQNETVDKLVTPNHRCIVEPYYKKEWEIKEARDVKTSDNFPISSNGRREIKEKAYSDEFVELVGWVVTEGNVDRKSVRIYQNVGDGLDRIHALCDSLGYAFSRYVRKDGVKGEIRITRESSKDILSLVGDTAKNLPMSFVSSLTHGQLKTLYWALVEGDGHVPKGGKYGHFNQKDKGVSDSFQALVTLMGRPSRLHYNDRSEMHLVSVKSADYARQYRKTTEMYSGRIWCPTNDNGTVIVRRNGKVMLTGQSREEIEVTRKRMNNPRKFAQEYGLEFLSSGRPVFDFSVVRKMREKILETDSSHSYGDGVSHTVYEEDGFRIYQEPESDTVYVAGVDVSEGVEDGDYSVVSIFRRDTGEEVAMYRGLLAPDRMADKLNSWGRKYNNALMVVEINNHGLTTVTYLKNLIYPSIYFRPAKFEVSGTPLSNKLGWKTTKVTRPLMIDELAQYCREGLVVPHSKELLDEMLVFVYDDHGNMGPMPGFHDDCVFSAALAIQGFKVTYHDRKLEQLDYTGYLPASSPY